MSFLHRRGFLTDRWGLKNLKKLKPAKQKNKIQKKTKTNQQKQDPEEQISWSKEDLDGVRVVVPMDIVLADGANKGQCCWLDFCLFLLCLLVHSWFSCYFWLSPICLSCPQFILLCYSYSLLPPSSPLFCLSSSMAEQVMLNGSQCVSWRTITQTASFHAF